MLWKPVSVLTDEIQPPAGFTIDQLGEADVEPLTARLRQWFPQVTVGGERCHLTPAFYRAKTQLREVTEDRRIFPVVVKKGDAIVSLTTIEKDRDDLTITARMGVVDPDYRGAGLGHLGPRFVEVMGRAIGAELAYYFTTMRIPHEQVISERLGFRLVGILPGSDREPMDDGSIKRVPEALYAKLLVPESQVFTPPDGALTESTRRFWRFLFGSP